MSQNYVNHVALVLDASGSMQYRENELIKVVDGQIAYLARRSQDLDQETRVTVYTFNSTPKCVIYDKDVLRLPSIASLYHTGGFTALIDATILSQKDLALTPEKYGDHSFLTFVFTDGQENKSQANSFELARLLADQPSHWTVGVLVPNFNAKLEAKRFGFTEGNIAVWDVNSDVGISEVGETIRTATDNYMASRASGVRGTRTLFSTDATAVNADTIRAAGLQSLPSNAYLLVPVTKPREAKGEGVLNKDKQRVWEITDFVKSVNGGIYKIGTAFYQLSKQEKIGGNKALAILDVATSKVYHGDGVRAMIGLPEGDKRVAPDFNPQYKIFVQSQSPNRHLVVGTKVLILR